MMMYESLFYSKSLHSHSFPARDAHLAVAKPRRAVP
jgi:hypothetical protein